MRKIIPSLMLTICCALLPSEGLARQWTDAEIGSQLSQIQVVRSRELIAQMIAYGQDGPEGQHLQLYLWEKLAEAGPHELTDAFARSVLDAPTSRPLMRFGALGYMAYAPQEWMKPYASSAISHSDPSVKSMGFYLAALLGMSEHVGSNAVFSASYAGEFSEYALIALAMSQSMETIFSAFKASADDNAIATALAVAKYREMTAQQKEEFGEHYIKSGDIELCNYILMHVLSSGRTEWLVQWQLIKIEQPEPSVYQIQFTESWVEPYALSLGYRIHTGTDGLPKITVIERNSP